MFAADYQIPCAIKARPKNTPNANDRFCCGNVTIDQGRQRRENFKSLKIGASRQDLASLAGSMLD